MIEGSREGEGRRSGPGVRRTAWWTACCAVALTAFWSCSDSGTGPDADVEADCTQPGTPHSGAITASETWRRTDSPHHVTGEVTVGKEPSVTLTVEPGALICFAQGASIATLQATVPTGNGGSSPAPGGVLLAAGTAELPIVFTATDPAFPWDGITIHESAGRSLITHATLEHATKGIEGQVPADLEHVLIRRIGGPAVVYWHYNAESHITDTRIDSAGLDGGAAMYIHGGTLRRVQVTASGGVGMQVTRRYAQVTIRECAVSGSGDDGIRVTFRTIGTVPINECNLVGNAGVGIANGGTDTVDARGNWWGDPAGPGGPQGDGVSGPVDTSEPRSTPVTWDGRVP